MAEDEGGFWDWEQTPSFITGMESSWAGEQSSSDPPGNELDRSSRPPGLPHVALPTS